MQVRTLVGPQRNEDRTMELNSDDAARCFEAGTHEPLAVGSTRIPAGWRDLPDEELFDLAKALSQTRTKKRAEAIELVTKSFARAIVRSRNPRDEGAFA